MEGVKCQGEYIQAIVAIEEISVTESKGFSELDLDDDDSQDSFHKVSNNSMTSPSVHGFQCACHDPCNPNFGKVTISTSNLHICTLTNLHIYNLNNQTKTSPPQQEAHSCRTQCPSLRFRGSWSSPNLLFSKL